MKHASIVPTANQKKKPTWRAKNTVRRKQPVTTLPWKHQQGNRRGGKDGALGGSCYHVVGWKVRDGGSRAGRRGGGRGAGQVELLKLGTLDLERGGDVEKREKIGPVRRHRDVIA